jgi:hypothetical protein
MKKLSLGKLKISTVVLLERTQLANIYGGSASFGCAHIKCAVGFSCGGDCRCEVTESDGRGYCVDILWP